MNDTSKTILTHHARIMIAEEIQEEFEELHVEVNKFIAIANSLCNDSIVSQMKKIVPEFISNANQGLKN